MKYMVLVLILLCSSLGFGDGPWMPPPPESHPPQACVIFSPYQMIWWALLANLLVV